jgi:hypothetical protein
MRKNSLSLRRMVRLKSGASNFICCSRSAPPKLRSHLGQTTLHNTKAGSDHREEHSTSSLPSNWIPPVVASLVSDPLVPIRVIKWERDVSGARVELLCLVTQPFRHSYSGTIIADAAGSSWRTRREACGGRAAISAGNAAPFS